MFGRDILQIPCARDSLLNGIYAGAATLILTLMATSRASLAADAGVGLFCVTTLGSFVYCRYDREKTRNYLKDAKIKSKNDVGTQNEINKP